MMRLSCLFAVLLLAACTHDPQFGSVVQNNIVAHVVDLEPVYAGTPIEGSSGERSVEAVRRLNKGNAKALYTGGATRRAN